jgi:hypothetical protein
MTRLLTALLALWPLAPHACEVHEPFEIAMMANAPIIARGIVTGYTYDEWQGYLNIATTEVLQGDLPAKFLLIWPADMVAEAPPVWDLSTDILFAAYPLDSRDDFRLASPLCSDAQLLPATPENLAAIRAVLAPGK